MAALEAVVLDSPELDALELEESAVVPLELKVSDDPPPQPASASAATASARTILALAALVDFTRRR